LFSDLVAMFLICWLQNQRRRTHVLVRCKVKLPSHIMRVLSKGFQSWRLLVLLFYNQIPSITCSLFSEIKLSSFLSATILPLIIITRSQIFYFLHNVCGKKKRFCPCLHFNHITNFSQLVRIWTSCGFIQNQTSGLCNNALASGTLTVPFDNSYFLWLSVLKPVKQITSSMRVGNFIHISIES
jgi:hypothetical protein